VEFRLGQGTRQRYESDRIKEVVENNESTGINQEEKRGLLTICAILGIRTSMPHWTFDLNAQAVIRCIFFTGDVQTKY
jgi:hypothetical protein